MDKGKISLKIILTFIVLLGLFSFYFTFAAEPDLATRTPATNTWSRERDINFTFTPIGENASYEIKIYVNWDQYPNFTLNGTLGDGAYDVANNSLNGIYLTQIPDSASSNNTFWEWFVSIDMQNETNLSAESQNATNSSNFVIKVDNSTPIINTDTLANNTVFNTNNVIINMSVDDINPDRAYFFIHNITNATPANVLLAADNFTYEEPSNTSEPSYVSYQLSLPDGVYLVDFGATDLAESTIYYNETNKTFTVDSAGPTITLDAPLNGTHTNLTTTRFNITVTDDNIDTCQFYLSNESGVGFLGDALAGALLLNVTNSSGITSGTTFGFNEAGNLLTLKDTEVHNAYTYAFECNDTSNKVTWTDNFTVIIDSIVPSGPTQVFPFNDTITPDFATNLTWGTLSNDTNFANYTIYVSASAALTDPLLTITITNNDTDNYNISIGDLPFNETTWYWTVNVTDHAGNTNGSSEIFNFTTETHCANLTEGWNLCGLRREGPIPLSQLLVETNADRVAILNTSNDFETYVGGFTSNQFVNVTRQQVALIHINSTVAQNYWKHDWVQEPLNDTIIEFNLTNISNGYNLITVQNKSGTTFQELEDIIFSQAYDLNTSIERLWFYNNTALDATDGKIFIPFKIEWNQSENLTIGWSEPLYIQLNFSYSQQHFNFSCTPNSFGVPRGGNNVTDCNFDQ